ncbi:MAG: phosphatidylglycerophosphatase A, partial [Methanobacterium sp.]
WFINIILLINKDLKQNTLIKAYSKALESKIVALWDLDVRKPSWDLFTGNNDDELICACTGFNNEISDVDELQNLVEECVRKAVGSAMLQSGFSKGIIDFIEGVGIKIDDLVKAGMELLVGVEESEELRLKLHQQILKSLEDLNVVSFIIAGIRLEEDYMKHRVEGINVDDDPAYLYSDEVFGMSIANQIAGTKAIFNFKRYDEEKPGIISGLGPVLDDVFAGLVAGCMSKIFED